MGYRKSADFGVRAYSAEVGKKKTGPIGPVRGSSNPSGIQGETVEGFDNETRSVERAEVSHEPIQTSVKGTDRFDVYGVSTDNDNDEHHGINPLSREPKASQIACIATMATQTGRTSRMAEERIVSTVKTFRIELTPYRKDRPRLPILFGLFGESARMRFNRPSVRYDGFPASER